MSEDDDFSIFENIVIDDSDCGMVPPEKTVCPEEVDIEERYQNMMWKDKYAFHVLLITYIWLGFLIATILGTGILAACGLHFVSDTIIIALISATSLSAILGLCCIILNYLFHR